MRLRPFMSYFGSKWKAAPKYPAPLYDTIIEPFAGGAGYSIYWHDHRVVLCDLNPVVTSVWDYLIHVKASEIRALPLLGDDESVDDLSVCQEAKWLIGFWLHGAISTPVKRMSSWAKASDDAQFWNGKCRARIAAQVDHIRHWKIYNRAYNACPEQGPATWFVDPPYQVMGKYYKFGSKSIDFEALGAWCQDRTGQAIVCENEGADWLPFRAFTTIASNNARNGYVSREVIWTNPPPCTAPWHVWTRTVAGELVCRNCGARIIDPKYCTNPARSK